MPIPIIIWAIVAGVIVSTTVVVFYDEIKKWATRVLPLIFDAIKENIEEFTDAIVSLINRNGVIYKVIKVFVKDFNNNIIKGIETEVVPIEEVPKELRSQLFPDKEKEILRLKK